MQTMHQGVVCGMNKKRGQRMKNLAATNICVAGGESSIAVVWQMPNVCDMLEMW